MRNIFLVLSLACLAVLSQSLPAWAIAFPEPSAVFYVYDDEEINAISPPTTAELVAGAQAIEATTSVQVVVAAVENTEDLTLEEYTKQLFQNWQVGRQENSLGGVLLVLVIDNRQIRVQVGHGLETVLTPEVISALQNEYLLPQLTRGDLEGGLLNFQNGLATILPALLAQKGDDEKSSALKESFFAPLFTWPAMATLSALGLTAGGGSYYHYHKKTKFKF